MTITAPASFLNLDLEVDADFDLSALADHFQRQTFVLFSGPADAGFRLTLEPVIEGALNSDPIKCTEYFLDILEALPASLLGHWNSCRSRVFDYGFDGGLECPPIAVDLPANLLARAAQLQVDFRVTVYPYREETLDEE